MPTLCPFAINNSINKSWNEQRMSERVSGAVEYIERVSSRCDCVLWFCVCESLLRDLCCAFCATREKFYFRSWSLLLLLSLMWLASTLQLENTTIRLGRYSRLCHFHRISSVFHCLCVVPSMIIGINYVSVWFRTGPVRKFMSVCEWLSIV